MDAITGYFDTLFRLVNWFAGSIFFFLAAALFVIWFLWKNIKGRGE